MILTDQHIAQMRETVERTRLHGVISGINITPDALEALLDRLQATEQALEPFIVHNSSEPMVTVELKSEDIKRARQVIWKARGKS